MNSREFVQLYMKVNKEQNNQQLDDKEAIEDIETLMDLISDIVLFEEDVKFKNKGKFTLTDRKSKIIGDPQTGERREIYPKKKFKFEQSKMKEI